MKSAARAIRSAMSYNPAMDWLGPCGLLDASGAVPRAAPVVPRVLSPDGHAALPLESKIRSLLKAGARGVVNLSGPLGSGKSVAVEHLAAVLPKDAPVALIDDDNVDPAWFPKDRLTVYTSPTFSSKYPVFESFVMAPWRLDDCIEYLTATHRSRCKSVIQRIDRAGGPWPLQGLPELWRIVLDVMAADESISDIESALRWHMGMELPNRADREHAGDICIQSLMHKTQTFRLAEMVRAHGRAGRLLRHADVQLPLAAESLAAQIASGEGKQHIGLPTRLPGELIDAIARLSAARDALRQHLQSMANGSEPKLHANAATLLCAIDPVWRPPDGSSPDLKNARLQNRNWAGLCLVRADFSYAILTGSDFDEASLHELSAPSADFSQANLRRAWLQRANLAGASFQGAKLAQALMRHCDLVGAELTGANANQADLREAQLTGANLCKASFRRADLRKAMIHDCRIENADFRRANFRRAMLWQLRFRDAQWAGASFRRAILADCDLENVELPGADFRGADLKGCSMTDSFMPGADFRRANLAAARLAGVEWPGANLRNADLSCATFHLGTSRSGLVGSTIPCEGSKTGFYTDDYNDQGYKCPEEIRKANLCGADLRGARIDHVDFYLVDLRGAKYSAKQRTHLARTGAILSKHA